MMNFKLKNKGPVLNKSEGFTLVEMLVSISIFVLVAFTITSTLIAVSNGNRKAQELKQVMDNLNFSVQSMVLRMREGRDYTCGSANAISNTDPVSQGQSCGAGGDAIVFYDPTPGAGAGTVVRYYLDTTDGKKIVKFDGTIGTGLDVTSEEVEIDQLNFIVGNAGGVDGKPYVIISIAGTAKLRSSGDTKFNLQTFVSQHK